MPYYKEKNLLFIHIPKTGGRVIESNITKKCNQSLYGLKLNSNELLDPPHNNCSPQHLFYSIIYQFREKLNIDFSSIKVFTIVRNPYDRIISDLFWFKFIKPNFTQEQVYNVIKNDYLNKCNLDNHNIPQYKFVTNENCELVKNIKIFKTETLNESNDDLNNFLGFDINIKKQNINKNYSQYLNNDSISLINNFYKKDFELFDYQIKIV